MKSQPIGIIESLAAIRALNDPNLRVMEAAFLLLDEKPATPQTIDELVASLKPVPPSPQPLKSALDWTPPKVTPDEYYEREKREIAERERKIRAYCDEHGVELKDCEDCGGSGEQEHEDNVWHERRILTCATCEGRGLVQLDRHGEIL